MYRASPSTNTAPQQAYVQPTTSYPTPTAQPSTSSYPTGGYTAPTTAGYPQTGYPQYPQPNMYAGVQGGQAGYPGYPYYPQPSYPYPPQQQASGGRGTYSGGSGTPARSVYLGGIPPETTQEELQQIFSRYGTIDNIKMLTDKNCAFVNYADASSAQNAMSTSPTVNLHGKIIKLNFGKQTGRDSQPSQQAGGYPGYPQPYAPYGGQMNTPPMQQRDRDPIVPSRVLWVGNLTPMVDQAVLAGAFGHLPGYITSRIVAGKGFGFCTFDNIENATGAKHTMLGRNVGGMPLKVNYGKDNGTEPTAPPKDIPQMPQTAYVPPPQSVLGTPYAQQASSYGPSTTDSEARRFAPY